MNLPLFNKNGPFVFWVSLPFLPIFLIPQKLMTLKTLVGVGVLSLEKAPIILILVFLSLLLDHAQLIHPTNTYCSAAHRTVTFLKAWC